MRASPARRATRSASAGSPRAASSAASSSAVSATVGSAPGAHPAAAPRRCGPAPGRSRRVTPATRPSDRSTGHNAAAPGETTHRSAYGSSHSVDRGGARLVGDIRRDLREQGQHDDVRVVPWQAVEPRGGQTLQLAARLLLAPILEEQERERAAQADHARMGVGQGAQGRLDLGQPALEQTYPKQLCGRGQLADRSSHLPADLRPTRPSGARPLRSVRTRSRACRDAAAGRPWLVAVAARSPSARRGRSPGRPRLCRPARATPRCASCGRAARARRR